MDAVTGLPVAIEPHGDAGAGTGQGVHEGAAGPSPAGWEPCGGGGGSGLAAPSWPRPSRPRPHQDTPPWPAPPHTHLHTRVAMITHQAVQQQSASRCSSLLRRRQHSQKE